MDNIGQYTRAEVAYKIDTAIQLICKHRLKKNLKYLNKMPVMFNKTKNENDSIDYRLGYVNGANDGYRKAYQEMVELIENEFYGDLQDLKKSLREAIKKQNLF